YLLRRRRAGARAVRRAGHPRGGGDAAPGRQRDGHPGGGRRALAGRLRRGAERLMHPRAAELIRELQLVAHPEGGYYRRLYESAPRVPGGRACSSAIVFLWPAGAISRWHRIDADELWHFYEGEPLELLIGDTPESLRRERLGPLAADCLPQRLVPAN